MHPVLLIHTLVAAEPNSDTETFLCIKDEIYRRPGEILGTCPDYVGIQGMLRRLLMRQRFDCVFR